MAAGTAGLIQSGTQFVGGLLQAFTSGKKKTERDLENYAKSYDATPNASILDVYNKAYNKYSANPYTSQYYQNQTNQIQRNLAGGINASQDRRGGLANIAALTQGANDATARAGVAAEQQQGTDLNRLMSAAGMKANEENSKYNKKYDLLYNLKAMKASAANAQKAAGLQNAFNALGGSELIGGLGKKGGGGGTNSGIEQYGF